MGDILGFGIACGAAGLLTFAIFVAMLYGIG